MIKLSHIGGKQNKTKSKISRKSPKKAKTIYCHLYLRCYNVKKNKIYTVDKIDGGVNESERRVPARRSYGLRGADAKNAGCAFARQLAHPSLSPNRWLTFRSAPRGLVLWIWLGFRYCVISVNKDFDTNKRDRWLSSCARGSCKLGRGQPFRRILGILLNAHTGAVVHLRVVLHILCTSPSDQLLAVQSQFWLGPRRLRSHLLLLLLVLVVS